jgi:hypothetical protein
MNLLRTYFKRGFGVFSAVGLASVLGSTSAFGFGAILTIDNNGDAFWTSVQPFPYTWATEPVSGLNGILQYTLPFTPQAGDILLETSGGGPVSDVIRFDSTDHAYFFSTTGTGTIGYSPILPTPIAPNVGPLLLQNSGGVWSVNYTPTAGQPGFDAAAAGSIYHIVVYVPEPGLVAFGAGAVLLLGWLRSRK